MKTKPKKGETITFKDGSTWRVKKIFDTNRIQDKIYKALQKAFDESRYQYTLTSKHGTEILMSEKYVMINMNF